MIGAFLDFENQPQVVAFIHAQFLFLPEVARAEAEAQLDAADEASDAQVLMELARSLAKKTWPCRQALRRYLEETACEEEWRLVVAAVSKSTAHLLERFRHGTACESLDATLAHDDSESAFRVQERAEIAEVRRHVHDVLWRDHQDALVPFTEEAEVTFEAIMARLETLRELAVNTPWIEGEVLGKVTRFEDDFLFAGKILSLEQLDEEVAYYREQKALPAT